MNEAQFNAIKNFREEYKAKCDEWSAFCAELVPLQKSASQKDTPPYPVQTPVVYNRALDEITRDDEIRLIVIGDNPGKDEQLEKNNRYLVGQSGKIAEGFFRKNSALGIQFRENTIILNKTPIHTAKTSHLKFLAKNSERVAGLILQSQIWLAQKTAQLHKALLASARSDGNDSQNVGKKDLCELWLVGYAELKPKGIFVPYRDALLEEYRGEKNCGAENAEMCKAWERVFVYQHFSMNRFLIDLKEFSGAENCAAFDEASLKKNLETLGAKHRREIFGE